MNLVANTGIQLFTVPLEINLNDNFKMYFHEWFDTEDKKPQLKLEIAHFFSEDDKWVSKKDIYYLLGLGLTNGEVGRMEDGIFIPYQWEEIKDDFFSNGKKEIIPMDNDEMGTDCFALTINRCRLEKVENHWLPLPYFKVNANGKSNFGPINWCRFKLIPDALTTTENIKRYNLLLAFDTRSLYENEGYEEEDLQETPVFINEDSKDFALCDNEFMLVDFCTKHKYNDSSNNFIKEIDCEWVDEVLLRYIHECSREEFDGRRMRKPRMIYMAQFVFIIRYIWKKKILQKIKLYRDKFQDRTIDIGTVDLVVDMGNSRTCTILFDRSKFTDVEPLRLQNFSNPIENGKLNCQNDSFDMRLAFHEADFGGSMKKGSSQFTYPSMVRLGVEANELIHKAVNQDPDIEKITTFSSPKRYLWDNKPHEKEWEFLTLQGEQRKPIRIKGISEQLTSDGSLNETEIGGVEKFYSRKALMTFCFLEIFSQAKMQINSYEFRHNWGPENMLRRLGRIIISCPTAMSRLEQIALRKCAEDADIILNRFYSGTYYERLDEKKERSKIQVIPNARNLRRTIDRKEWIYDEATCAQFVYLYAEISRRYRNNVKEYFNIYGKLRNDIEGYKENSLTIGSVDIGAGTTDLMIATYKYDYSGQCKLTPIPLFWESFYMAGDDLLKNLIRKLVIEGPFACIQKHLTIKGVKNISEKIFGFFAPDNAQQNITCRQIRSEFNLQVSIPVVLFFLELLNKNEVEIATLCFSDIFTKIKPTKRVLDHFKNHFGFSIEEIQWNYNKEIISKIIESTFSTLVGQISTILSYFGCDIVLLSGRPTSLKPLSDLFLKYYAVSPNRLITLNNYRIGTWYPFHDGKGYFKDAKSIVAVGAMIGNYASTRGSLEGFSLDLSELAKKILPTTDYFSTLENNDAFIKPGDKSAKIKVDQLPMRIWTRQLDSREYPTRPFYRLNINSNQINELLKNRKGIDDDNSGAIRIEVTNEGEDLLKLAVPPYEFNIERDNYIEDKETLRIVSVFDKLGRSVSPKVFTLQIQSMSEPENYWLDSGEFENLNINHF